MEITREECAKRLNDVDQELQTAYGAAANAPSPRRDVDLSALARGLAGAFALFSSLVFDQQRDLLRRAVSCIPVKNREIPSITLRGGFLGEILGAERLSSNSVTVTRRSRSRRWRRFRAQG
jgi:hypothetical protein